MNDENMTCSMCGTEGYSQSEGGYLICGWICPECVQLAEDEGIEVEAAE